ncbi:MAG: AsmA family protein [Pseudomonadota bacterium]
MNPVTRHPIRSLAIALAGMLVVLILVAIAMALFWPAGDLRERVTRQASDQLGMPVTVGGDVALRFWPAPAIHATDVRIESASESGGDPPGELEAINLSMRWLPLLRGRLVPETLRLDAPVLRLTPGTVEALALGGPPADAGRGRPFTPLDLRIRDGEIHWNAPDSGRGMSITGLDLDLADLEWPPAAEDEHPLARASLNLTASAGVVRINALRLSDISLAVSGKDGTFTTDDWQMTFLDSRGSGNARMDFRAAPPAAALDFDFGSLELASLPDEWAPTGSVSGSADLTASLESGGREPGALPRHLQGKVKLSGRELRLRGVDLDEELAGYRRTQRFSLVDAGAVVFLGPAWLLASKGSDFARLLDESKGAETRIVHLVSDWTIDEGTAHARDVALSTTRNRVAARASLDLPSRRINHATVAVVDRRGCPIVTQDVHGSFDAPRVEEPNLMEELFGAPLGLLQRGLDAISRKDDSCEVFYAGSVAAPSE